MTRTNRWIGTFFLLSLGLISLGCQTSPKADSARDKDVVRLMAEAMTAAEPDARTTAALAAADRATETLANAIAAVDRARDISACNLANAETTAFKSTRALFESTGKLRTRIDFAQGSLENTSRELDIAIEGQGFFRIKTHPAVGDGIGYTRNGNLVVNSLGDLVVNLGEGYKLDPPVNFGTHASGAAISMDGSIIVKRVNGNTTKMGEIQITRFSCPEGLSVATNGIYAESAESGHPIVSRPGVDGAGMVMQGFLESSNVDTQRETLRLRFLDQWRAMLLQRIGK